MATLPSLMAKGLPKAGRIAHSLLRTHQPSENQEPSTCTITSPAPLNSLPGLPVEIKQAIFSSLPDMASLKALISTCSCFYKSFLDCESSILTKVLLNQITPSLMPNAVATFKSSEMTPWTKERAENLLLLCTTGETSSVLRKWTLRNALVLSKMHEHVQFFTHRLTVDALLLHPVTGLPEADRASVSPSELRRIQRALYRFEFYCNLFAFRRKCNGGCSEILFIHFRKFAPWENEQLACICDHLTQYVSKRTVSPSLHRKISRADRYSRVWHRASNLPGPLQQQVERCRPYMLPGVRSGVPAPTRSGKDAQRTQPHIFHLLVDSGELLRPSRFLLSTALTLERRPAA